MLTKLVLVAAGGSVGAVLRYLVQLYWVERVAFPVGTLCVNVIGCAVIGSLMCCAVQRPWLGEHAKLLVITGLLGSLTTFSTFGFESFELIRQGKIAWAGANVLANVVLGLAGVWAGWVLTDLTLAR